MALKRVKIAYAVHSTYSTYARGTSILIAKSAPITIKHFKLDPSGCFVILVLELLGKPYKAYTLRHLSLNNSVS